MGLHSRLAPKQQPFATRRCAYRCARAMGEGFRQRGVLLGKTANLVWEKGFLTTTKVNEWKANLKVMGALHRSLGLSISLWPHLWVDHMVEVAGRGFKAEGRHKPLQQEV